MIQGNLWQLLKQTYCKDVAEGRQQAKLYADLLEKEI